MYEEFADVYDRLMGEIPYGEWAERIRKFLHDKGIVEGTVCELGCGTGTMTELMADAGYHMIGIDQSPDMLALAQIKKETSGNDILYLNQDMEEMVLAKPVDVVISVCDSLNYILEEESLDKVFANVRKYLRKDGYFIFDMKTEYCYSVIMGNRIWADQDELTGCIWENNYDEEEQINEYQVTVFQKKPDNELYQRFEEIHYQRAYATEVITGLLQKQQFSVERCMDENWQDYIPQKSERMYVIAKAS